MKLHRFYCKNITQPTVELIGQEARHIKNVYRLDRGAEVELFDGLGSLATGKISFLANNKIILDIQDVKVFERPNVSKIIIAPSVPKGDRFDWLIAKCTELSVDRIMPIICERTVKTSHNPKILDRWENLAIAAAKQCKRLFLPKIEGPLVLDEAIKSLRIDAPKSNLLFGSLDIDSRCIIGQNLISNDCAAIIGPEGGFTDKEIDLLKSANGKPVYLTDTILRVETAALTFAAILSVERTAQQKFK